MKEGHRLKAVEFPPPCEECTPDMHPIFGCGFNEHRGNAQAEYQHGAPETKTCPQFFARQPFVNSIVELVEDYRRGALGDVLELPASLFDYLRIADREVAARDDFLSSSDD